MNNEKKIENLLYSRNYTKFGLDMNPVVSIVSGLIVLIFSGFALIMPHKANELFLILKDIIVSRGDWVFILTSSFFILLCIFFAFSRLGNVRLGGFDAEPEYSDFGWYSMLISAGMGIGLMFWSVGEPLYHATKTPPIYENAESTVTAMATTFFHWGIHPWSIYALMALALAFFAYNQKLPLSLRSVFYPILKDKVFGIIGDIIDIFAVVACLFGLATSLGLGAQQINSGLNYLVGIPFSVNIQVILIIIITFIATLSVVSGIDKGVKFLSEINIKIALVFLVAIFLLGPTGYIINLFSNSLGLYLNNFFEASFFLSKNNSTWQGDWTVFYLAWWISWSPFVGMFIARISKGRTIREFIFGVLIIPSLLSFIWLATFGGAAFSINNALEGGLFSVVQDKLPIALFEMINNLGVSSIIRGGLSLLGTLLVISFFVTSSDSGSLVVDNITSGGKLDSPVPQRIFWAAMEGLIAASLLLAGGKQALSTLQTAVICTGLPFALILLVMSISLLEGVHVSYKKQRHIRHKKMYKKIIKENKEDK